MQHVYVAGQSGQGSGPGQSGQGSGPGQSGQKSRIVTLRKVSKRAGIVTLTQKSAKVIKDPSLGWCTGLFRTTRITRIPPLPAFFRSSRYPEYPLLRTFTHFCQNLGSWRLARSRILRCLKAGQDHRRGRGVTNVRGTNQNILTRDDFTHRVPMLLLSLYSKV